MRTLASGIAKWLCLVLIVAGFTPHQAASADNALQIPDPNRSLSAHQPAATRSIGERQPIAAHQPRRADFESEPKSRDAEHVADWIVDSGDNSGMPFAIVDKLDAKVFVFGAEGRLRGAAPVLVGLSRGDDAIPGIGEKKLSEIKPDERTTPAGRFVASLGFNFNGKDVLWVDYDGAVSMHRVVTSNPKEHRLQRLATPTVRDNRISFGCINVPANFYDDVVKPTFTGTYVIVYVLPDTRSIGEIFQSYYDVKLRPGTDTTLNLDRETRPGPQQRDLRVGRHNALP